MGIEDEFNLPPEDVPDSVERQYFLRKSTPYVINERVRTKGRLLAVLRNIERGVVSTLSEIVEDQRYKGFRVSAFSNGPFTGNLVFSPDGNYLRFQKGCGLSEDSKVRMQALASAKMGLSKEIRMYLKGGIEENHNGIFKVTAMVTTYEDIVRIPNGKL